MPLIENLRKGTRNSRRKNTNILSEDRSEKALYKENRLVNLLTQGEVWKKRRETNRGRRKHKKGSHIYFTKTI